MRAKMGLFSIVIDIQRGRRTCSGQKWRGLKGVGMGSCMGGEAWERAIHKVKDLGKVYVSKGFSRQKLLFCKYFFVVNVIYG